MNDMRQYVEHFFEELEVFEDLERGHCCRIFISQAVYNFLGQETKENAFAVYRAFFDSYRITLSGATNPFIDLLDVLKNYEENAAVLIDKQRDHYIHSVNVFILGLCIYAQNKNYRSAFQKAVMDPEEYPYAYHTKNEEFFLSVGACLPLPRCGLPGGDCRPAGQQIYGFCDRRGGRQREGQRPALIWEFR